MRRGWQLWSPLLSLLSVSYGVAARAQALLLSVTASGITTVWAYGLFD
jgi:hypothetical protein